MTDRRTKIAKALWHRFAKSSVETWDDETHKAEYLDAADQVLDLTVQPNESWEPAQVNMQDYWREAIGGTYTPAKLSKNNASHPTTIKRVLEGLQGTEAADVIVSLIFWASIVRNREDDLRTLAATASFDATARMDELEPFHDEIGSGVLQAAEALRLRNNVREAHEILAEAAKRAVASALAAPQPSVPPSDAEVQTVMDNLERASRYLFPDLAPNDSCMKAKALIARLHAENFALAANQCHAGYGDEYGNHRCRDQDAAPQPTARADREAVARIINPRAFIIENSKRHNTTHLQAEARAKADAILALATHQPNTSGEREAFKAGWYVNADTDQPADYLKGCEEVDWHEHAKTFAAEPEREGK
jgi:hypothetical protein